MSSDASPPSTPILDSGVLPKRKKKTASSMVIGLLFGIPLACVLIVASNRGREGNPVPSVIFLAYFASFMLAVTVHELGHLLAGWIVGFRFSALMIGPVSLHVEYGRLRVRVRKSLPAAGYAGMRVDRIIRVRRRLLIFVLGGPAANLLTALATRLLFVQTPPPAKELTILGYTFWMISALFGVLNLLPIRTGALFTDGARVLMLFSSLPKARRWLCHTAIIHQTNAGVRPKLWRRTWLEAAGRVQDNSIDDFAANWLAYLAANDRKDSPLAASRLERCLSIASSLGPALQDTVMLEAAVFSAWFRKDPQTAEKWRAQVRKAKALPKLMQKRVAIALCCAHTQFGQALSILEESLALIGKLPPTPIKGRMLEGLAEWKEEILERQALQPSLSSTNATTLQLTTAP